MMRGRPWLRRLVPAVVLVVLVAAVSSAIALSAFGGSGPAPPPPASLAQALQSAVNAPPVPGLTGTATLTGDLFPDTSPFGALGSSLTSATGHFSATGDGSGRIDLQTALGSVQIGWTQEALTIYEPSSNTAYELQLPTSVGSGSGSHTQPTVAQIEQALSELSKDVTITGPQPVVVADQPAYSVSLVPKDDSSLVGEVDLTWDATYGIPLHIAVTPRGQNAPAIDVALSDLTVGNVDAKDATLTVPAGAKVVQLSLPSHDQASSTQSGSSSPAAQLAGVEASVPFDPVAPATLDGRALSSAHAVGGGALLTYGTGLAAIVVGEGSADAGGADSGPLSGIGQLLPHVSLGPVSAQELETTLGTVLSFDRNGIAFVVGASLPKGDVEAAAQALT
jgi:outer membrane lipoprotein-sorting protein